MPGTRRKRWASITCRCGREALPELPRKFDTGGQVALHELRCARAALAVDERPAARSAEVAEAAAENTPGTGTGWRFGAERSCRRSVAHEGAVGEMKDGADEIASQLAEAYVRLDRALDAQAAAQRRVDRCRERIRQLRNGAAVKAPAGDRDIAALMAATISVSEAAVRAGKSPDTIVRWCIQHGIGAKVGFRWRVFPDRLRTFLKKS
jgi:hypothetical protein